MTEGNSSCFVRYSHICRCYSVHEILLSKLIDYFVDLEEVWRVCVNSVTFIGLCGLTFLLGFRHGIDWDHIAAISDLVGGTSDKKEGFRLALWYAAGHEVVIVVFGSFAVLLGKTLPSWIDGVMERFVGITLLILAAYYIVSLFKRDTQTVLVSRWKLLFVGFYNLFGWIGTRFNGRYRRKDVSSSMNIGWKGAFSIGVIHGTGAETPTQLLLFATASGLSSPAKGFTAVALFVIGLFVSHLLLAVISVVGYVSALKHRWMMRIVGGITAIYGLFIGSVFTLGYAGILPTLL